MARPAFSFRLCRAPGALRGAVAGFSLLLLGFAVASQVNLWVQAGQGSFPSPQEVLERYHGRRDSSRLHKVLDPERPPDDPLAMYPFLGTTDEERQAERAALLDWVEAGAPREAWPRMAEIVTDPSRCGGCHVPDGQAEHLPFTTYENVLPVTLADRGMSLSALMISAHNHLFGFAILALVLSVGVCFVSMPGLLRAALIAAVFVGPALDVGGWFLTRSLGAPFHWLVMVGGGLFGASTATMALLLLGASLRPPRGSDPGGTPASSQ